MFPDKRHEVNEKFFRLPVKFALVVNPAITILAMGLVWKSLFIKSTFMKYLILACATIFLASAANSQTTGSNSANSTTHSSEGARGKKQKSKKQQKVKLDHRKNYKWKTGQQATPTGQEATGVGSGYSATKKDTSGKRED